MRNLYLFLLVTLVGVSCRKETFLPSDPSLISAVFTLESSGGNCSVTSISGSYFSGTPLDSSNTVTVLVNVSFTGSYSVATSAINGIKFLGAGRFITTGIQTITLKGIGTPTNAEATTYLFSGAATTCSFIINVSGTTQPPLYDNDHMLLGNPTNAAMVTDSINNFLMRKTQYALSYSRDRGTPNWVSWHLHAPDLGSTPRQDDFRPDNSLPAGWYQVPENAYSGSGFDRGHNTPSADRTSMIAANSSTFLMTNMIPQAPNHNQQTWARLEDSLRRLVNAGFELYIIMGSYGVGGTGANGFATVLHNGRVTVPASIWKIAVIIPNGNNDIARININTRVIAVNIPNTNSVNSNWKNFRVSADAIESATGNNVLKQLPASVQLILEARVDNL